MVNELVLYIQMNLFSFLVCFILLMSERRKSDVRILGKISFSIVLGSTCIIVMLDSISRLLENNIIFPNCIKLHLIVDSLYYILQVIPVIAVMLYALDMRIGELINRHKLLVCCFIPAAINVILVIINVFHPFIFVISENNVYSRANGYIYIVTIPLMYGIAAIILGIMNVIKFKNAESKHFLIAMFMISAGATIQTAIYGFSTIWMTITICIVYLYVNVQSRREKKMEKEIVRSRVSIMLSQIQPHFLYNVIATIRELCMTDPSKAANALTDFSKFLRGNMDAIDTTEMIHFTRELEHVKYYINLELNRFGELLNVEYNIAEEDFWIPPLTIQPLMENAIKYGVGEKSGGGTVKLSTWYEGNKAIVEIKDDGIGFDVNEFEHLPIRKDGRSHIGLSNVRKRVKEMAHGELTISSKINVGTTVRIELPKKR